MILGSDPELFLVDTLGNFKSSVGLIGGSKEKPRPVLDRPGFAVQEDNVALEFNIPPSKSRQDFIDNLSTMITFLEGEVGKMGLKLSIIPSARFPKEQLDNDQSRTFGCDADFNAWSMEQNPKPICSDATFRTCGGHIHFTTQLPLVQVIRAMDLFLAVPAVLLDPDTERRNLYGLAGCYRATKYGGEYRTLSNFWLKNKDLMGWAWDRTEAAFAYVEKNREFDDEDFLIERALDIEQCINNSDKELAQELMNDSISF